jgi:hypothetical protein
MPLQLGHSFSAQVKHLRRLDLPYIKYEQSANDRQGDALWRLAHTAVATSWHSMINQRGEYDSCGGVQLVLTAFLSQVYAALSKV